MAVKVRSFSKRHWHRLVQIGMASLALAASGLLLWPERPGLHADESYNEKLVPALTAQPAEGIQPVAAADEAATPALPPGLQPIAQTFDVPPAPCNCGATSWEDDSPLYVSAFGGLSYFDADDTSFGGQYGLNMSADLTERLGVMATGLINHYSGASQFAGAVGGYVRTNYYGDKWDRFGGAITFDQFTDTGLGDPYLAQARYLLTYRVLPSVTLGVEYTDPLIGDDVSIVPGAGTTPFRAFQVVQGLLSVGGTTLGVGYVDELDSMTFTYMQTRRLTERWSTLLSGSYDENVGLWTGFVGLEFELTRRGTERWLASRSSLGRERDVVRGGTASSQSVFDTSFGDDWDPEDDPILEHLQRQALRDIAARQNERKKNGQGSGGGGGGTCPDNYSKGTKDGKCWCFKVLPDPGPADMACR